MKFVFCTSLLLFSAPLFIVTAHARQRDQTGTPTQSGPAQPAAPQPPEAPGYRRILPWGQAPENPDVFWEIYQVSSNTTSDKLYAFQRSDTPLLESLRHTAGGRLARLTNPIGRANTGRGRSASG